MAKFTESFLRSLTFEGKSYKISEDGVRGNGRLLIKVLDKDRRDFYYRYRIDNIDKSIKIGRHRHFQTDGGMTLAEARVEIDKLIKSKKLHGDVKQHIEIETNKLKQKQLEERRKGTFEQLLDGYVNYLAINKKVSAKDVESLFKLHIKNQFPELVQLKAKEIQPEQIRDILAKMVDKGIERRVNMMRSYLSSAFNWGAAADLSPLRTARHDALFGIKLNPCSLIPVIKKFNKVSDRNLSDLELDLFWKSLDEMGSPVSKTLQVLFLLGGQRATQLLRCKWSDWDESAGVLTIWDLKGNAEPREHLLPVLPSVKKLLLEFKALNMAGPYIFSAFGGQSSLTLNALSTNVLDISQKLSKSQYLLPFRFGDLRRTAETHLAKINIDKSVRSWLLSHGRGSGVQSIHYDKYSYLPQKRETLEKWELYLAGLFYS